MQVKILGPLEAYENGVAVTPIARKQRQVFSLLALCPGTVVSVPALIEELWGATPPASAMTTLQTYIMHVRRGITTAFGSISNKAAKDVLRTRYGGYLLDIDGQDVDAYVYERLTESGKRALEHGDLALAAKLLRQSLALWRGDALVDVHAGSRISEAVTRLQESRLGVLELVIEIDIRLGRHAAVLADLSGLTARYPMNENLCGQFMLALYRSGRKSQALEAFIRLRGTLVNELGVEPSSRIQRLQHAILRSEPALDIVCPPGRPIADIAV
ncbi:AfsR/SARP family transcriptional regulator [Nocardia asteroides]